jgi:hypothetical protein
MKRKSKSNPTKAGDLVPNEENPRQITDAKLAALGDSLKEFGDLSGLVLNLTSNRLVSGHQRLKHLDGQWPIAKVPFEDATGTVAVGTIDTPFGRMGYREVRWPNKKERLAMIAANQHGGDWDKDQLEAMLRDLAAGDLRLAGFDEIDLSALGIDLDGSGAMTPQQARTTLAERFGIPPFSVLDARQGYWQERKRAWLALGIKSDVGRGVNLQGMSESNTEYAYNKKAYVARSKKKTHD